MGENPMGEHHRVNAPRRTRPDAGASVVAMPDNHHASVVAMPDNHHASVVAMPDFHREVHFGYFLIPDATHPLLDTAREVERRGLDYIGIQDHPYQRRFVDTFVVM